MTEWLPMKMIKYRVLKEMTITTVGYGGFFPATPVAIGDTIIGNTKVGRLADCQVVHAERNKRGELHSKEGHPTKAGRDDRILFNPEFLQPIYDNVLDDVAWATR